MSDFRNEFYNPDWENLSGGVPEFSYLAEEIVASRETEEIDPQSEREKFRQPEEIVAERTQNTERPEPFATAHENVGGEDDWDPETDPFDPRKQDQAAHEQTHEDPAGAEANAGDERNDDGQSREHQETQNEGTDSDEQQSEREYTESRAASEPIVIKLDVKKFKRLKDLVKNINIMAQLEEEATDEDRARETKREAEMKEAEQARKLAEEARALEKIEAAKATKEAEVKEAAEKEAARAADKERLEKQQAAEKVEAAKIVAAEAEARAEDMARQKVLEDARAAVQEAFDGSKLEADVPVGTLDAPLQTPAEVLQPVPVALQETPAEPEVQAPEPVPQYAPTMQTDVREYASPSADASTGIAAPEIREPVMHTPPPMPTAPPTPAYQPAAASAGQEIPRAENRSTEAYVRGPNGEWQRADGGANNSTLNSNPYIGKSREQVIGMLLSDKQGQGADTGGVHPPLQKPVFVNRPVPGARATNTGPGRTTPNAAPHAASAETPRAGERRPVAEQRTTAPQERVTRTDTPIRNRPMSPLTNTAPMGRQSNSTTHKMLRREPGAAPKTVLTRTREGLTTAVKAPLNIAALPTYTRNKITDVSQKEGKRFSYTVTYTRNGISRIRTVRALSPGGAKIAAKVQNVIGGII